MLVAVASELRMVIVMSALRIGVIRMKNKEKFSKEIVELACDGNRIAVIRQTGEFRSCYKTPCIECLFHSYDKEQCKERTREWAESEYIEKPAISKRDKAFLEYLSVNIQYIARDMSGRLYIYVRKPYKQIDCWSSSACEMEKNLWMFNVDFPMVKWSDDKPWLIEELKKLDVVENYE